MNKTRNLLLAAGCTAAGALGGGGISALAHGGGDRHHGGKPGFSHFQAAVHAEYVVPRGDDAFSKVSFSRGKVGAVDGDQLTVKEGTGEDTYDTVTYTIPDDAKIFVADGDHRSKRSWDGDDDDRDQLSDLGAGDKVSVWQSKRKTVVFGWAKHDDDNN